MRKTRLTLLAAAAAALAIPANAAAQSDQVVTGVPSAHLAVGVTTPVFLTNFKPGQTASGTGTVAVVSTLGDWDLSVTDSSTNAGRLAKDGNAVDAAGLPITDPLTGLAAVCPASAAAITNNALNLVSASGALGSTSAGALGPISNGSTAVASGSLTDVVTTGFQLAVDAGEAISGLCAYRTTLTYTVQ